MNAAPLAATPRVLHLDAACVVVDKPAGLLSVPGRGPDKQDCLARRVQALWPEAQVVHRLDMGTSGVWLMARGPDMQRAFSRAFEQQAVDKHYVAVVAGRVVPPQTADGWGVIDLPLAADWPRDQRQPNSESERRGPCQRPFDRTGIQVSPAACLICLGARGHPRADSDLHQDSQLGDSANAQPHTFMRQSSEKTVSSLSTVTRGTSLDWSS